MSLAIHDSRSRGRSKSPGRRDERSRSRDIRAPSPPSRSKKSKKYYSDEESESDSRSKKKQSKKYYDDDSSDSGARSKKKHSKKYYDDESSVSDDRRKKKHPKKRYEEEEESYSSSESGSDRRSRHKQLKSKREVAEPRHRHGSSPDTHSKAVTHRGGYAQSSTEQREREHRDGRHTSYASSDHREHPGRGEYTRHLSYSSNEGSGYDKPGHGLPGQYKWEYDHGPDEHERGYRPPQSSGPEQSRHLSMSNVNVTGGHQPYHPYQTISPSYNQLQYGYPPPTRPENHRTHSGSLSSDHYQYAEPPQQLGYASKTDERRPSYTQTARPQFVEAKPHNESLHISGASQKLQRLSISGGTAGALPLIAPGHNNVHMQGGLPPGSPLLESYHGTYQSISPMPSPLMLPSNMDDDMSDLDQLSSKDSSDASQGVVSRKKSTKKRVSFYDPEPDALALAAALKHTKPDPGPIIEVLPRLSDDHILELRTEYKKHIKVSGKGINIAKHIKIKVTGNLGKIAYAVALGRWESEAHWANFWYQSNTSRRELLIESLMGRTNSEIMKIKDAFSDKRYDDSLEKCMQAELKKDKFRNAVMLALEEKRMPEKQKLSIDLVRRDVQDLYKALMSKDGGETAMINIIVVRSDNHLREVLRVFEGTYKKNFAREMIKKSQNLVVSHSETSSSLASPLSNLVL